MNLQEKIDKLDMENASLAKYCASLMEQNEVLRSRLKHQNDQLDLIDAKLDRIAAEAARAVERLAR